MANSIQGYMGERPNLGPVHGERPNLGPVLGERPNLGPGPGSPNRMGSPTFPTRSQEFPYGVSGVSMPNYGYQGEVYQFNPNGYPRKSRTCGYCGKVFTRSTTRRYHEKRCPLLRAAVFVSSENQEDRPNKPLQSHPTLSKPDEIPIYGRPIMTGLNSQDIATSQHLAASQGLNKHAEDLPSYTSVIVKQEAQDNTNVDLPASAGDLQTHAHYQTPCSTSFSPESAASSHTSKQDARSFTMSPFQLTGGIDLSKSPSHASSGHRSEENVNLRTIQDELMKDEGKESVDMENAMDFTSELLRADRPHDSEQLIREDHFEGDFNISPEKLTSSNQNSHNASASIPNEKLNLLPNRMGNDENNTKADVNTIEIAGKRNPFTRMEKKERIIGVYRCAICGKTFDNARQLHVHEQIHTKFKPYACRYCGQRFAKVSLRITHERAHTGENSHICAVCGSSFTRKYSLRLHMHRRHCEGPWLCRHCGKASLTQNELHDHLLSHNLPKNEKESVQYILDSPMAAHMFGHETGENGTNNSDYSDSNDNSTSPGNDSHGTGQNVDDPSGGEKEVCQECGKEFPKNYMRYHTKVHEGQKPYGCPICGKRFGYKNNMKSHIKLHAGIKPYQCNVCGAKFTRGSTLRRHARRHGIEADSVWDLFVKNERGDKHHGVPVMRNGTVENGNIHIGSSQNTSNISPVGSSTDAASSKFMNKETSDIPDSSISFYDGQSQIYASTSVTPNAVFMNYPSNGQPSIHSVYSPIPSTSPLSLASGFPSSQSTQDDALNLSVQRPGEKIEQPNPRQFVEERSRSWSGSGSGCDSDLKRTVCVQTKPICHDATVQVKCCCSVGDITDILNADSGDDSFMMSSNATSTSTRVLSNMEEHFSEGLSSLLVSGRLFRCEFCECYFSEYAMFRIHAKLHSRDVLRPFVCPVCNEDCHDRIYFTLHLSEHLR